MSFTDEDKEALGEDLDEIKFNLAEISITAKNINTHIKTLTRIAVYKVLLYAIGLIGLVVVVFNSGNQNTFPVIASCRTDLLSARVERISNFLIVLLLALACFAGQSSAQAIENGAIATGEPVVGLFYEGSQGIFCSGAVLEPRIVVTAHHCIPNAGEYSEYYLNSKILVSYPGEVITFDVGNKARVIEIVTKKEKWSLGICARGFCDDLDDIAFLILDRDYPVPENLKIASQEDVERFRTSNAQVVTYGYGRISYAEWSTRVPQKLNANLEAPNQGGYGTNAFNIAVKGNQNVCSGDSGGPTYVLDLEFIYYLGPTSVTRRPSCIENPITRSGFFGGTFLAAKGSLFAEAQERVIQIRAEAELEAIQEAEAKAAAELRAKKEAEAKAAAELRAKQEAEAKAAADKAAREKVIKEAKADASSIFSVAKSSAAKKKITITCIKGKLIMQVTAVKPVCPKGYEKK